MKKVIILIAAVIAALTVSTTAAAAVSVPELSYQISICQKVKETAHTMANCARWLGYGDDHVIIQISKSRWRDADAQEQQLTKALLTALGGESE